LGVAEEMLGAVGVPLHRPLQALGRDRAKRVLAVKEDLGAEAAADVRRDHPHPRGLHLEDALGQVVAQVVAALAAKGERPAAGRFVVLGDAAAGLEVVRDQAVVDEGQRDDPVRAGEGGIRLRAVSDLRVEGDVARNLVPDQGGVGRFGGFDARDGVQRLPGDRKRFGRVAGRVQRFGDHEGDRVAHMAHHVARQHRIRRRRHRGAVRVLHGAEARQGAEMGDVVGGQNEQHAVLGLEFGQVADREAGVGVGAPHHEPSRRVRRQVVVRVAAGTGDEAGVLHPAHGLADAEFFRGHLVHGRILSERVESRV
jgi:hypothetical protein